MTVRDGAHDPTVHVPNPKPMNLLPPRINPVIHWIGTRLARKETMAFQKRPRNETIAPKNENKKLDVETHAFDPTDPRAWTAHRPLRRLTDDYNLGLTHGGNMSDLEYAILYGIYGAASNVVWLSEGAKDATFIEDEASLRRTLRGVDAVRVFGALFDVNGGGS